MRLRTSLTIAAASVLAVGAAAPAEAAATRTVAKWEMNESAGARTMGDSSGNGINGSIGTAVVTGVWANGARGYRFPYTSPTAPPAKPERLVRVADDGRLDPGSRDYAVAVRLRTTNPFGNIIQKGQSGVPGGYWKFQAPNGVVQCLFRGSAGSIAVGSGRRLDDGNWHTVRCERTGSGVTMTVDGAVTGRRSGPTGSIANSSPLTIGGKLNCDQYRVSCDYFSGDIDRVQIWSS